MFVAGAVFVYAGMSMYRGTALLTRMELERTEGSPDADAPVLKVPAWDIVMQLNLQSVEKIY